MNEPHAWRYVVPGMLFLGLALYMLVTGELQVDKQRAMVISRAASPLLYWPIVSISTALGLLAVRAGWRILR